MLAVDNAGTVSGVEKIGIEIEVEQIASDAGCTDAGTKFDVAGIEMGETEAECVERRVIAVDTGFALGSAAVTSAISAAQGAASVVAQFAAVPLFASAVQSVAALDGLAVPAAVAVLPAFAFPRPSAAAAAVQSAAARHVVALTAAGEFASAVPTTVAAQAAVDTAAVASAAAIAGASAVVFVVAIAAGTGTALVAADS